VSDVVAIHHHQSFPTRKEWRLGIYLGHDITDLTILYRQAGLVDFDIKSPMVKAVEIPVRTI
jgi:hypothetical protein